MTRLASSPPTSTAAEVSSHDVSMPRTASATAGPAGGAAGGGRRSGRGTPLQRDRIGNGPGGDAARRDDRDPRDPDARGRPRDVGDDAEGVARQRLHPLFGTPDRDRDACRRDDETRD